MAAQLCRWDPELKMIGLRFSNVMRPEDYAASPTSRTTRPSASGTSGATSTPATAPRPSGRALESDLTGCEIFVIANADTVMEPAERRAAGRVLPRRRGARASPAARHAAVDRQGPPRAGLRAAAQLARRARRQLRRAADQAAGSISCGRRSRRARRVADSSRCHAGRPRDVSSAAAGSVLDHAVQRHRAATTDAVVPAVDDDAGLGGRSVPRGRAGARRGAAAASCRSSSRERRGRPDRTSSGAW